MPSANLLQKGEVVGTIFECHPNLAKAYGLKEKLNIAILENPKSLNLDVKNKFSSIQKFPIVPFSISLLVDLRTNAGDVIEVIKKVDSKVIKNIVWKENFIGDSIPDGKVSMTIDMNFVKADGTMSGEEIEKLQNFIVSEASQAGYHLREK